MAFANSVGGYGKKSPLIRGGKKMVTVCAWCDKENDNEITEKYEQKGVKVSHGMCDFHFHQPDEEYWEQFDS